MDGARPLDPAELLAHVSWVQRLARALVRDADAAADLAQETLRVTLEQPGGRVGGGAQLRAWLQRVARRLALDRWRADASRASRERAVAPREPTEGTFEVVARSARQQRVVAAVHELAEPYRSTILYRYLDELPTREVARRMDVTEEVVRKRLERGLAQLRARLDSEFGSDTKSWALALLTLPGVAVVTVKTQIAIAAALLITGAAVTWQVVAPRADRSPGAVERSAAQTPPPQRAAEAASRDVSNGSAPVAARSSALEPDLAPKAAAAPAPCTLRVHVVDPQGNALTEGRLTFVWLEDEVFRRNGTGAHTIELPIAGATTDVTFPPQACSGELTASVPGRPPSPRLGMGGLTALHNSGGEMTIEVGGTPDAPTVSGRVLVDGKPEMPRGMRIFIDGTNTAARVNLLDGRFVAGPLAEPSVVLFVTSDETVPCQFEVAAGSAGLDLELTRGKSLELTVLDRTTHEPIPGIELYVTATTETKRESPFRTKWRDGSRFVVTDGAGVATVRGIPMVGIVAVRRDGSMRRTPGKRIDGHPVELDVFTPRDPLADFKVDAGMADPIERTIEIDAVERPRVVRGQLAPALLAALASSDPPLVVRWARVDTGEQGRHPDGDAELAADGAFRFLAETSGAFRVWAECDRLRLSDVASRKVEAADPEPIELHARAGGFVTLRLVHVPAKGFVHVYVEDPGSVFKQATVVAATGADVERRIAVDGRTWLMAGWYLERGAELGSGVRREIDPATTSIVEIDLGADRQRKFELSFTAGAPPPQSQVALFALDRKADWPTGVAFRGEASSAPVAIDPGRYLALLYGAPGLVAGEVTITAGLADEAVKLRFAVEEHLKSELGKGVTLTQVGGVDLDDVQQKVCTLRFADRPDLVPGDTVLLPVGAKFTVLEK